MSLELAFYLFFISLVFCAVGGTIFGDVFQTFFAIPFGILPAILIAAVRELHEVLVLGRKITKGIKYLDKLEQIEEYR